MAAQKESPSAASPEGLVSKKWRRRESNPRPVTAQRPLLRVCPASFNFASQTPRWQGFRETSREHFLAASVPSSDSQRSGLGYTSLWTIPATVLGSDRLFLGSQSV